MRRINYLIALLLTLCSCANKMTLPGNIDVQFIPDKSSTTEINGSEITYIIPHKIQQSEGINGLIFEDSYWEKHKAQKKIITHIDEKVLTVERRVDNGAAGSGRIYNIDITKTDQQNNKIITLRASSRHDTTTTNMCKP